ncbi:hypothetical protein BGW36DRAFT_388879 [Talaromyces proteolyticus]|uniref:Transcription factor domain-containing protein n=1 Tax=Talaromyces proteolyticus TaxID=1131652 RepID=A0AAD4KKT5_9EURO|nr:uncharacterized protein BGW36DRAFT_388879 [Talaromyces proteolyticus]KAH8690511.1 hypothetical protein BGW36DRAFT_388879 [Talaromyces proteolyticus]
MHWGKLETKNTSENVLSSLTSVVPAPNGTTGPLNSGVSIPTGTDDMQPIMDWDALDFLMTDMMPQSPRGLILPHSPEPASRAISNHLASQCNGDRTDPTDNLNDGFNLEEPSVAKIPWSTVTASSECSPSLPVFTHLSQRPSTDILAPIPMSDPVSRFSAGSIMQMLRAFPQMMLRRETFPPFIHGHWHRSSKEPSLPKPLINCMALAQVFISHNLDTRSFLWHSIRMELRSSVEKTDQQQLSKPYLLGSIQSQLIYMMMRVIDGSQTEPDLNMEMLVTWQGLCESFKKLCKQPFCQDERVNPSQNWEDWVFAESRRRTVIVWLVITQMVHIKIGVPCDIFEGFQEIPLPSPKSLWEAKTRSAWQSAYDMYKTMPRIGLDLFGDLLDAHRRSDIRSNQLKLDSWNAVMDHMGILLNFSTTMI